MEKLEQYFKINNHKHNCETTGFPSEGRRACFSAAGRWMFWMLCGFYVQGDSCARRHQAVGNFSRGHFPRSDPLIESFAVFPCCPGGLWKPFCLMFALPLLPSLCLLDVWCLLLHIWHSTTPRKMSTSQNSYSWSFGIEHFPVTQCILILTG